MIASQLAYVLIDIVLLWDHYRAMIGERENESPPDSLSAE